jgi:hypothetical protein
MHDVPNARLNIAGEEIVLRLDRCRRNESPKIRESEIQDMSR